MIIKKDSEIVQPKGERRHLALKAKKTSIDEESLTFRSKDEEYAMVVRDFKKFFKRRGRFIKDSGCSKHMTGNQMLFSSYKAYNKGQICDKKCRVTFFEHDSKITKDDKIIGESFTLKLSNSNSMSYSEMLDMLVYKLECEIRGKNLYADFLHGDCVDDYIYALDYWNYEYVYFSGCFDVGVSNTGCDWIDERVGYVDCLLLDISKAKFSKETLLDDGGSSSATSLSFVLKRKGKSRVKFTRKREILKKSKMLSLRKGVRNHNVKDGVAKIDVGRSNYGSLVSFIGLNEDVCDDEPKLATRLSQTGGSPNNDFKDVD
uniref:Transposase, Ptta/En/Spm, transposase, Tnp1/En/Spm-like protein n=1 Tax=Tanacetum cinerariifolium TaxID=118510 RepID=A0A6L2NF62_TANCI|nr:transposase, Ptta/En/Spm, transposase, Tnp1/En/Spm-like protein [Tanacetum cinerariifolium]